MGKPRRTTHRSRSGKKLYAVRDSRGRFKDIQTFERAHRMDLRRKSADELETARAKPRRKKAAKAAARKKGAKTAARKKTTRKLTRKK